MICNAFSLCLFSQHREGQDWLKHSHLPFSFSFLRGESFYLNKNRHKCVTISVVSTLKVVLAPDGVSESLAIDPIQHRCRIDTAFAL